MELQLEFPAPQKVIMFTPKRKWQRWENLVNHFLFVHPIRGIVTAEYEIKLAQEMKLALPLEEQP